MSRPAGAPRSVDPTLTRQKGFFAHPGTLALGALAVLFTAYIFNFDGAGTWLDSLFNGGVQQLHSHNDEIVHDTITAAPIFIGAIALLFLYFVLLWLFRSFGRMQRSLRLRNRPSQDIQDFATFAATFHISRKVALHSYQHLKPFYGGEVRAHWNDDLRKDLHLREVEIEDLISRLLHSSDRKQKVDFDYSSINTIGQMLRAVEDSPAYSLTESMVRRARGEKPLVRHEVAEPLTETRLLLPAHKRIQMEQKVVEEAPKDTLNAKSASLLHQKEASSGDMILPLHKRFKH